MPQMNPDVPPPFDQGVFLLHYNRGREAFQEARHAEARRQLELAQRMRPDDSDVLNLLGLVYFKTNAFPEAEVIYRRLAKENPNIFILHSNLGLILFKQGKLEDAEYHLMRAIELRPNYAKSHLYLGLLYRERKKYGLALEHLQFAGAEKTVREVEAEMRGGKPAPQAPPPPKGAIPSDARPPGFVAPARPADNPKPAVESRPPLENPKPAESRTPPAESRSPTLSPTPPVAPAASVAPTPPAPPPPPSRQAPPAPPPSTRPSVDADASTTQRIKKPVPVPTVPEAPASLVTSPGLGHAAARKLQEAVDETPQGEQRRIDLGHKIESASKTFSLHENGFLEINFRRSVYIKKGTVSSYSGNLKFVGESGFAGTTAATLVKAEGAGKIFLYEKGRKAFLLDLNDEFIYVEGANLLALEDSLSYRIESIYDTSYQRKIDTVKIFGKGSLAISTSIEPLTLRVTRDYPLSISSNALVAWTGNLIPAVIDERHLDNVMIDSSDHTFKIRFEGDGVVVSEQ